MQIIEQMLDKYNTDSITDKRRAIKEVMQEIVLSALAKAGFFKDAAFYGGTALRIFHGLDRFSEDLDFTLLKPDRNYDFEKYVPIVKNEVNSFGIDFTFEVKKKTNESSKKSAFLKGNTREHFLIFYPSSNDHLNIIHNEKIKIKVELDTDPPAFSKTESIVKLLPYPHKVRLYDMPSLFAGKIHAVICRSWKSRVKGRDLFDYVFYLSKKTPVNLDNLKAKLVQSSFMSNDDILSKENLIKILSDRFEKIDYEIAKMDVIPFINNENQLDLWTANFFQEISKSIIIQ